MRCLFVISIFFLTTCKNNVSLDDVLYEGNLNDYHIQYNAHFGYFVVKYNSSIDTISLQDNWLYVNYRYRQQQGNIDVNLTYDEFLKSEWFCLPGSEQQFKALNKTPLAVFGSTSSPTFCDCIDSNGVYLSSNPKCEGKFQVFRSSYNDSLSWYYSYYRDLCSNKTNSISFNSYKDSILLAF